MRPPVIVIGMHRAGTSLLAEVLGRLGVFMGYRVSGHNESLFFMRVNQYIFNIAHARWDRPLPVKTLMELLAKDDRFKDEFIHFFHEKFIAQMYDEYWGGDVRPLWGWKDPRNTFTLPAWLYLYPEAKVICIYRNGVDVAKSLQTREIGRPGKMQNHIFSCRCLDLNKAFNLWAEYTQECYSICNARHSTNTLSFRYEDLLLNPSSVFVQLEGFLQVSLENIRDAINGLMDSIKGDNAYKYKSDPELAKFYEDKQYHPFMRMLEY